MPNNEKRGLSPQLQAFLDAHFDSVEQIEVLVLLSHRPEKSWTVEEIDSELRSSPTVLKRRLNSLHAMGALGKTEDNPPQFHFHPQPAEIAERTMELLDAYRVHRIAIIELIYSRPRRALQSFVDAFKLTKEDSDG